MQDYYIKTSNIIFIFWMIIGVIITLLSAGTLFLILIIPLYYYLILRNSKYYYNDEKMIVETGILNKKQNIIPLYRIVNITARDNIFNFGEIYIKDKQQTIVLKYVNHSKEEMLKLIDKWEIAKKKNIRNEVI